MEQRQREGPIPLSEAEDALIVVNRRGLEGRMGFALDLECRTDPSNSPDSQIGRQPKPRPNIRVQACWTLTLFVVCSRRATSAITLQASAKAASVASSSARCSVVGASLQAIVRTVSIKDIISHANVTYKHRLKPKRFLVWDKSPRSTAQPTFLSITMQVCEASPRRYLRTGSVAIRRLLDSRARGGCQCACPRAASAEEAATGEDAMLPAASCWCHGQRGAGRWLATRGAAPGPITVRVPQGTRGDSHDRPACPRSPGL